MQDIKSYFDQIKKDGILETGLYADVYIKQYKTANYVVNGCGQVCDVLTDSSPFYKFENVLVVIERERSINENYYNIRLTLQFSEIMADVPSRAKFRVLCDMASTLILEGKVVPAEIMGKDTPLIPSGVYHKSGDGPIVVYDFCQRKQFESVTQGFIEDNL